MIVYFSASSRNIKEDIVTYKRVIRAVRASGHNIANDWTETALLRAPDAWDIREIVGDVMKAIENSELLIAEASDISTFGVGYEVSLALQGRKPVLILFKEGVSRTSYAAGLENDFLTFREYNEQNLEKIVHEFIAENEVSTKDLRFNFVIDRKIYNHLRQKSFKLGKTKAEVIRDLLAKDIEND